MKSPILSFLCLITSMICLMQNAFPGNNQLRKQNQPATPGFFDQHRIIDQDVASVLHFYPNHAVVERFAEVKVNGALTSIHNVGEKESLVLNVFEDVQLMATVSRMITHGNGSFSIIAGIDDLDGYVVISTIGNRSLGSIYIPELKKYYKILSDPQTAQHYLIEMDARNRDILESAPPLIPEITEEEMLQQLRIKQSIRDGKQGLDDPANIDVMIVYTPAAETWANNNGSGGIENVVAQSMANAQLVLDNSETLATVTLAHSEAVDYVESGSSSVDLIRFTASPDFNPWGNFHNGYYIPGFMDEIHEWRDEHAADLSALFAYVSDVGGIAWLLNDINGLPQRGFSLTRVQQAATGYTHIHEMGHNMGLHHHKDQNFQPGPTNWSNWPENVWSAGWRWTGNDGGHYCSVMSYTGGQYYDDGIDHVEVPYFSNPDITYQGQPTGHAVDGDNARTVREIKHVIAAYRSPETPEVTTADIINIGSTTAWGGGFVINDGGHPLSARGVVWATYENPDLENNEGITFDGSSVGSFTSHMTGLSPSTEYFVRAYATNSAGTAYGAQKTFTTLTGESTYPVTFNVNNQSGQPIPNAMVTVYPERTHPTKHNAKLMTRSLEPDKSQNAQSRTGDPGMLSVAKNPGAVFNRPGLGKEGEWIHWDGEWEGNAIGTNAEAIFSVASRWFPEDLSDYDQYEITHLSFVPNYEDAIYTLHIWVGHDVEPNILYSQVVPSPEISEWNTVELDSPFTISAANGVWFGYEIDTQGGFPAGCDAGPQVAGKGNMILFESTEWVELTDLNDALTYNWSIQAYVVSGEDQPDPEPIILYTNAAGQASFDAMPGAYSYFVEKDGYVDATGNFNVSNAPVNINVTLEDDDAYHYSIAFSIIDQFNDPVENAVITMGDMVNDPGDYVFHNVPEGWHVYNVSALCYLPTEGEVLVDHDMSFDVMLFIDHLPGDANGDGTVNILDIIAMSIYWSGDDVSNFCFHNADVNSDGEVNILDIIATIGIFNIGKIAPYDDLDSEDAHAFINQQGIALNSDGTLAGLQFGLTGDFSGDLTLTLDLLGYELIQLNTGGTIRAMIYSFDNKPIPAGMISLVTFEGDVSSINMKHGLAGNLNAEKVPLVIHNEMITGVEEQPGNIFKAYPNPATNMLRVEFETTSHARVSLINVHGQLVEEQTVSEHGRHQLTFDTSKLPSGIYMLRLDHAGGFIIERIMVKKP